MIVKTSDIKDKSPNFTNLSESISQELIEKIISLSVSRSFTKKIEDRIPDYCFQKVKQGLEAFAEIQFITHDRDDLFITNSQTPPTNKEKKGEEKRNSFSIIGKEEKHENSIHIDEAKEAQLKEENPSIIQQNIEDNALEKEIQKREENADNHSLNNTEIKMKEMLSTENNLQNIQNKNNNDNQQTLMYDFVFEAYNNWDLIPMPEAPEIDRDIATHIKIEKSEEKPNIPGDIKLNDNVVKAPKKSYVSNFIPKTNILKEKTDNVPTKPKRPQLVELPCYEIEDEEVYVEPEEIEQVRKEVMEEEKMKEILRKQKLKKQRELEKEESEKEKFLKDLSDKTITMDVKGEIVIIRPLNIDLLKSEFFKASTEAKHKSTENKSENLASNSKPKVEKNPNIDDTFLKSEKNNNQKKNRYSLILQPILNEKDKILSDIQKKLIEKKNFIPGGSSFDRFVPEVGVTLKEEDKTKNGGKDFFKKYNRFSNETYQKQLGINTEKNKTLSKTLLNQDRIKEEEDSVISSQSKTTPNFYIPSHKESDKSSGDMKMSRTIKVKTKNLSRALDHLDLITEEEELLNNFGKTTTKNLFKKDKISSTEIDEGHQEMDVFAKTLMGNSAWGLNKDSSNKRRLLYQKQGKVPTKLINSHLGREVPQNMINTKLPRNRKFAHAQHQTNTEPSPILKMMSNTMNDGFFKGRKKLPKLNLDKIQNKVNEVKIINSPKNDSKSSKREGKKESKNK